MAVTNNFAASTLDLNGKIAINQPTALVWGPDGRLYVTEADGDVRVLSVAFGDKNPADADNTAQFYVTDALTLSLVKGAIQNHNDNGTVNAGQNRQVTGIDVTRQFDANGDPVTIDGKPAVTIYVTSSDSRIGAGGGGGDVNLDTNSGVITKMVQTGPNSWDAIDIVRGLTRSEENHATNGLEVIQVLDGDGKLVSERMIVASGGNANTGAPSNNFAGQQEQPLSGALLEVNLSMLSTMPVLTDANGRQYVYDLPTLDDPTRAGNPDNNDPFGGNDGFNSAKLVDGGPVTIYSPGYRNAYDVEISDDGRVWTYDNGANNSWGGRPIGEAGDNGGSTDFMQAFGYIATNLNNGEGNASDPINLVNWNPSNKDNFHEATRSDDLGGRDLSAGQGGAQTFEHDGLTYVYGGHPNPTRAEGALAGLLFSPGSGANNAYLLVSNQDSYADDDLDMPDYDAVIDWFTTVEVANPKNGIYGVNSGDLTKKVLAVTPGVLYDIYSFADGSGAAVVEGGAAPAGGTFLGKSGLPADIADIVAYRAPIEGDYKEAGKTDGALDTGNGSINGLTEYTSTILDEGGVKMSGAIIAAQLNGGNLIIMGRNEDGTMSSGVSGGFAVASDRTTFQTGAAPLGLASIGDDFIERGLTQPFQGSIWVASYSTSQPFIQILQPNNGAVPLAGQEIVNPTDRDLDGIDNINDPFEFSAENGFALAPGEQVLIDFNPQNANFPNTISATGLLGAALDGVTPNRDAQTVDENFTGDQVLDGLYDIGGNILPGGNAPILQIKKVAAGTVVGAANSARDALHTGIRPSADTDRIVATIEAKNWILEKGGTAAAGQLTGMMFGDGTQSNFVRFVFGSVDGALGFEVGFEIDDDYTVLEQVLVPSLATAGVNTVDMRLTLDKQNGFAVTAEYRLEGQSGFTALDLGGFVLPEGVLRDVLTGDHTIGTGAAEQASGAAIGFLAENAPGEELDAVDFYSLKIEAFGNEIAAADGAAVGGAGSPNVDTVIYTGTDTVLAPLAPDVENFDGTGSVADYEVIANDLDNVIRPGTGANVITTGAGADVVRGTLDQLAGDEITDFSTDDKVLVEGALINDFEVTYAAGSAILTINDGPTITFSGPEFEGFTAEDGPSVFNFAQTQEGVEITTAPALTPVIAINAGGPAVNGLVVRDQTVDFKANTAGGAGDGYTSTGGYKTYTNTTAAGFDFPNTDLDPIHVNERSLAGTNATWGYAIDVEDGTYLVDLIYAEIFHGFVNGNTIDNARVFDVFLEGTQVEDDYDIFDDAGGAGVEVIKTYQVQVTDGVLNIEFQNQTDQAKLSGLVVWKVGGTFVPPADVTAPVIDLIFVENPQLVQDGERFATVVLKDETGFDVDDFADLTGSELIFTGIVPASVSTPSVVLSDGGKTATLTYTLTATGNSWPNGVGEISIAAGAYGDAAGNGSVAAQAAFVLQNNLGNLERGTVVRAINVGTTDQTPGTLGVDLVEGVTDNNRYGGAIAADSLITDAFGNPIAFEADDNSWYTSPKSNAQLNANVDGQSGTTGSNSGGVDLDGSAYHTYRDSAAGSWTATYSGFAPGTYIVELHFAELFHTTGGNRQGDFTLNGQPLALNFDPFIAAGGADKPTFLRQAVTVTDGNIVVGVNADTGQPGFSAIVVYAAADPNLPPTISVDDVQAVEGGDAVVTFTRIGDLSEEVTVTFTLTPGTATADDYTAPASTTVVIPAGQGLASIAIAIVDDTIEEGTETFTVSILSASNVSGTAVIADGTATVTIAASDSAIQAPVGNTIFELDFEGVEGEALAVGGFDGALGTNPGTNIDESTSQVTGGKLVVQTSEGDINDGTDNGSQNDFTKIVDLSDPTLTEIFLSTRFDNPFDQAFFDANGLTGTTVPNYAQQGIVFGTGTQIAGEQVKLVWGGVAGSQTGVQVWTKGGTGVGLSQTATIAAMAPGVTTQQVASVELTLRIDKTAGTVAQYVTLFDADGTVLGGTRPEATPGFATAAPVALPAAVLANLESTTAPTHVGVHSSDNSSPVEQVGSFEATWDFLRLSSPQFAEAPVGDTDGPTATVTLAAPDSESDPIIVTVVYADASDIDPASIDAADLTLAGPSVPGAITLTSFDAATNTAVYSIAAPAEGWAEGDYTATVAGGEIADLAATPNTNAGGETGGVTLEFEDEPVAEYTPGAVIRAVNVGGPAIANDPILGIALEADDVSIIDPAGTVYADGDAGSDPGIAANLVGSALASERFGTTLTLNMANPDGSPLANGVYFVEIHFAELFQTAENARLFDVSIEGVLVADDLDLVAETDVTATSSQPYVISQAVEVTDGFATVVLDASAGVGGLDNAKIGALVIREAVPAAADILVSLTGPGTVVENSDGTPQGDLQNIPFTLTASDPAFTGTLDLTLDVDGVNTPLTGVAFTDGEATITVPVSTDTRWNDSDSVSVTLLSVETAGFVVDAAAASATATVTEDDPADSHDLDGDGGADPVVVGDFSDDRLAPTDIGAMQIGENILYATQQGDSAPGGRDRDFITFEVPEGTVLTQLFLDGYVTTETTAQGFMALQAGTAITVDPTTGAPDNAIDPEGPFAGIVYGSGILGNDLLPILAAGDPADAQGADFPGFDGTLAAGTYTLWLNQGGPATSVTLRAVIEAAPVAEIVLSIADAADVQEADGATLDFALTLDAPFTGDIDITYDTGTETWLTQTVSFVDGAGTLSVPVVNDDVDDGDDTVAVTLTGATGTGATFVLGTAAATGTVTEDDASPVTYVRGDVVAAFNAGGPALTQDGIDFAAATSGTDGAPFSGGAQFTDGTSGNGLQPVFNGTVYQTEINDGGNDATPNTFTFSSAEGIDPDKLYFVDLYFAEIFASAVGQRVFSVFLEGEEVLTDYDILANNGGDINAPVVVQLAAPVSPGANGTIDMSFVNVIDDRSKVSAIVIREAVAFDPTAVSVTVADVTVSEEAGTAEVLFTRTGNTDTDMVITYSTADGTATAGADYTAATGQTVTILAGQTTATASITLIGDDIDEGDEAFTVTIDSAVAAGATVTVAQDTATVTLIDDDAVDPLDIDGDGVLNTLDPSAYDDTNGAANTLAKGATISFDFDTPTADVFDPATGLTGVMVNLAGLNVNATPDDIYGTLTNEATSFVTEDGFLQVASSTPDAFGTGTNAQQNGQQDAYQAMFDVSGNDKVRFETRVKNPFDTEPASFLSLGLQIGAGDMDSFVKFVFGGQNGTGANGATRIQIGHNTSLEGSGSGETNVSLAQMFNAAALTAAGYADYNALLADIDTVVLAVEVDRSAATKTLKGVWTFENAVGDEIFSGETVTRTIIADSKLDLALDGLNPNTGGTGGVAFGIIHTDYNSGTQTAADTFTAQFDYLRAISLDEAPNDPPSAVTLTPVITEIAENTVLDTPLKVADIAVTDDGFGTNVLALTGAQADLFEIAGTELFLKAGTVLDFETLAALEVAVSVDDIAVGDTPDAISAPFVLAVTDVNEAPTLTVTPVITEIAEDADTAAAIVIATITVTDDALGTNDLTLIGADAGLFEINGTDLVLKAGTALDFETQASFDVSVVLDDAEIGTGPEATIAVPLTVTDVNEAPTVVAPLPDQMPDEDAAFSFAIPAGTFADDGGEAGLTLTATLADGSPLPAWLSFDPATATFSGTPLQADVDAGPITVRVSATDAGGLAVSDDFTLTPQNVNDAPTIDGTLAPVETTAGTATSVDLSGLTLADEDGTVPTLLAQLQGGAPLPAGITLAGDTLEVANDTPEGVYTIDIFADDGELTSAAPVSVTISVGAAPNESPTVVAPLPDQTPDEDAAFSFVIPAGTFADDGGEAGLTLTATLADDSPLPAWLSFDPATATFSGTPLQADVDAGPITVRVSATDAGGLAVSDDFTLTPQNVNDAPTIDGTLAPVETTAGTATSVDLSGLTLADEDGDPTTLVAELQGGDPLPDGITLDGTALNVADTLPAGVYTVDVFANDGTVNSATPATVTITVAGPSLNTVRLQAEDAVLSGYTVETQAAADDGKAILLPSRATGTAIFDLAAKGVAPGVYRLEIGHFDENDGVSQVDIAISGATPYQNSFLYDDDATSGNGAQAASFRVRVFENVTVGPDSVLTLTGQATQREFARLDYVEFIPMPGLPGDNSPPQLVGAIDDQTGKVGTAFDLVLPSGLFTDPDVPFGDALTLSAEGLPSGVTFDPATGTFSGTPSQTGVFEVTVTATDSFGETASDKFFVAIGAADPGTPDPVTVRLQAEDAVLSGYTVETQAAADDGKAIRLPGDSTGTATFDLAGKGVVPGVYRLEIGYFDENDGVSQVDIAISGATPYQNSFLYDDDATSGNGAQAASFRVRVFEDVVVGADSVLTLTGQSTRLEFARLDYVQFTSTQVSGDNLPPFAPFGIDDQTVDQNAPIDLDVASLFADPEEDPLTFTVDGPDWLSIVDGRLSGTPGPDDVTDADGVMVTVTAFDGFNLPVPVSFRLTVQKVNSPPTTSEIDNQVLRTGQEASVSVAGAFADADNDPLTYTVLGDLPPGVVFDGVTGTFTGMPETPGSYQVTVTASDGVDDVASTFVFNVLPPATGTPTRIEAEDFSLDSGFFVETLNGGRGEVIRLLARAEGEATLDFGTLGDLGLNGAYDLRIAFFDENDGISTASLLVDAEGTGAFTAFGNFAFDQLGGADGAQAQNLRLLTFPGLIIGDDTVLKLTARADALEFARIDYIELLPAVDVNFAPFVFQGIDDVSQDIPVPLAIDLDAIGAFADPEEDDLIYSILSGQPWLSIQNGVITGAPPAAGSYVVTVGATDGTDNSGVTVQTSFTVTVDSDGPVNAPPTAVTVTPVVTGIPEDTVLTDPLKVADIAVTDDGLGANVLSLAGADAALFEIVGAELFLKAGVTLDFETLAQLQVQVVVDDPDVGATPDATDDFTLAVLDVNEAPVGAAPGTQQVNLGAPVVLAALDSYFTDPDAGDVLSYAVSGLPAGVTLAADGITLEGTPTVPGVSTVTVTATDAGGLTDSVSFDLTVIDPNAFDPADYAPDGDLDGDGVPNADDGDVDGDGIPNADDPFAYDAENGMTLAAGETKTYDFGLDGTIFENGMTGFLQGTTNGGVFEENTGAATVAGGLLTVNPVTGGDTGGANNPQDDPVVGVKNGTFTATAVVLNPWVGAAPNPGGFDQLGLVLGLDSADMIKLVFGQTAGVVEFQKQDNDVGTKYGGNNPVAGGNLNVPLSTVPGITLDTFARAAITFDVVSIDATSATVTGTVVFLDGGGAELGTMALPAAPIGGALAAALADPAIGVAVGFTQVDQATAPGFIAQLDSLSISVPGVPDETDPPTAVITLTNPATATDPLLVSIALDDASGIDATTLGAEDLALTVNGFPAVADVTFTGFADGVASYAIAAPAVGWAEGLPVSVTLKAGEVADLAATPNVNAAASASLAIAIGGGSTGGGGADTVVFRINGGGELIAAVDGGPDWLADSAANPIQYLTVTDNRSDTFGYTGDPAAIPAGVPAGVFGTARSSDAAFSYDLPVSLLGGGEDYEVRLYFAETFTGSGAQTGGFRNFDATLEGFVLPAFDNIDPGTLFGANAGVLTGQVKVTDGILNIGFVQDLAQNPIINAIEVIALSSPVENPEPPVNPGNALDAFASQGDLFTGASYGAGVTGSALLKIMEGNNGVASSNFGANSFQVENIGAKNISAIFIDVTAALYPDSVFDPDGLGGDNAAKDWAVNSAGNTGGYVTGTGYFLPGEAPIPNSGGSGGPSNGGFKGAMVKFNPNVSGGFDPGEIVGFSGDMDPNSIAGMAKGGTTGVDNGAILGWDVGGISGHELIGSLFTVLFDDGTTASGQLMSDQSNAGAIALAAQNLTPSVVSLTVNGVGAGGVGTYGATTPTVIVTGDPGELVRVTMTRGLDPVTNGTNGIADLVEARLSRYDFKVNNAFDEQSFDVTIGANGTFDASNLFNYGVAQNTGKGSFAGDTVAPIGFVAAAIGTVSGNVVPTGPVTTPIYLTNQGGPVAGGPGGTGAEGYFEIIGSGNAARFKIQIEDENANGGQNPGGKWNFVSAPDAAGRQSGFQGDGYYVYGSETSTAINNVIASEILSYDIYIPEGETGIYTFRVRASRDGQEAGDQQNDLWLNFLAKGTNEDIEDYLVLGGNEPEPTNQGFIKVFGGPNNGTWGNASSWDGVPNNPATQLNITEAGLYTIEIAGRSQGFHVDFFELYKGSAPGTSATNSVFVEGEPGDTGGGTPPGGDLVIPIATSADDWEEFGGAGSNDLELGDNGGQQYVGLRFEGITIPQGAQIASAYIAFEAQVTSSGPASFSVAMENTENAAGYSAGNPPGGRSYTDEFIWNPEAWTDGETYQTPDLTELILSVIGNDGVTDGEFAFLIDGISGSRVAHPFDSGAGDAPTLFILFEDTIA